MKRSFETQESGTEHKPYGREDRPGGQRSDDLVVSGDFDDGFSSSSLQRPASRPRYFFRPDIPEEYGQTYMRALPRDPEWIYVYWEINDDTKNSLIQKMGTPAFESSVRVLRLIDVSGIDYNGSNASRYQDTPIEDYTRAWYFHVKKEGKTFVVECGFLTQDGKFFAAVRSNPVEVPKRGLSADVDAQWHAANTPELIKASAHGMRGTSGASESRFDTRL